MYITKNEKGNLAVISIETFERLVGKYELKKLLNEGIDGIIGISSYISRELSVKI